MPVIKTETYADIYELLNELDNRNLMLRAFGVLLECAMRDEANFPSEQIADGTYMLLEQQFNMLDFIGQSLRDQYHELKLSKFEVRDIDTVARASGVSKAAALSVISIAAGVPQAFFESRGEPA